MKNTVASIILAVIVLLSTTALGLAIIHITDYPYTKDIDKLNISETSDLPKEEILSNYNAMLDYLSPFSNTEFYLPTLKRSEMGSYHFDQVKTMFNAIYLLGFVSALTLIILLITRKAISKEILRISGFITIIIPAILGAYLAVDYNEAFEQFHEIFFEGDTWLFDPNVDEIINILPMKFFIDCAYVIVVFWIIGAAVQLSLGFSKGATENNKLE